MDDIASTILRRTLAPLSLLPYLAAFVCVVGGTFLIINWLPEVTKTDASVQRLRPYAQSIPNWVWSWLTWPLLATAYFLKTAASLYGLAFGLCLYVSLPYTPLSVSMICWTALIGICAWQTYQTCESDFQLFLIRPGDFPPAWHGFKRAVILSGFGRISVLAPPSPYLPGFLDHLAPRQGPRPIVHGMATQRQLGAQKSQEVFDYLLTSLDHFVAEHTSHLRPGKSFLERDTDAILAYCNCVSKPLFRTFGCEIAHPHKIDGSMHVVLHPGDVHRVIEARWGERHPLAREDALWQQWFYTFEDRPPVPETLCFIYAPRTYMEVCMVMKIVDAGARYVASQEETGDEDHSDCPSHCPSMSPQA